MIIFILIVLELLVNSQTCDITLPTHLHSVPKEIRFYFDSESNDEMEICFEFFYE